MLICKGALLTRYNKIYVMSFLWNRLVLDLLVIFDERFTAYITS